MCWQLERIASLFYSKQNDLIYTYFVTIYLIRRSKKFLRNIYIFAKKWHYFGLDTGKIDICGIILVSSCQCAAASCVRDGSRPPATDLQEQVANRRKRRWLRALVVSVTEKVLLKASGVD